MQRQKSVTKDYIYLLIAMNSPFDYLLNGLLDLNKLNHFLRRKQDIKRKNSVIKFVSSVVVFSFGDTFLKIIKMSLAKLYFYCLNFILKRHRLSQR